MTGIVVTGTGALSSFGGGTAAFWDAMRERRRTAPTPAEELGPELTPLTLCQMVPDGVVPDQPRRALGLPLGRATRAARQAAAEAAAQAGLVPGAPAGRTAVFFASGVSDAQQVEEWRAGTATPTEGWVPGYATAAVLAEEYGAQAAAGSLSNACAGGAYALAMGADLIRAGDADVVIAGGVEMYSRVTMGSFQRLGAVDPDGCRPFHRLRRGTGQAEGAAAMVLESEESARARGARPLARLVGSGWTCDAHHPTAPDPSGVQIARAMRLALEAAGRTADQVSAVLPHATGTQLSDVTECAALRQVFGPDAAKVPLYSLKALLGHTGGASGALSAVAAVLALEHGQLPPNLPVDDLDPECEVWLPTEPTTPRGRLVMINAFAFGGHNISLLFEGVEQAEGRD
ncbi:beta-ketoacyl-[acyl-carrier-protein] synthase family protein [Streptomyces palmae]|uniref:Beta-ketoacyl-[acyl-carrier-protein] synthase family protein n=1 Tax=Streptomyces palmae TaxID=1701085 RepID=A0A4Z0HDX9_9ACTN|nr:beta-ketoacyl-[acyl-carrier-protein] synthase family protein [Streptomyces palmae]TGB19335.1 beta-ketoacyl-[acyl-carrier-protein] synthase family protein [Streptomyces palmae]